MTLKLITVTQAAKELGLSRKTMYSVLKTGQVRRIKAGRRRLVPLADLERLIAPRDLPLP